MTEAVRNLFSTLFSFLLTAGIGIIVLLLIWVGIQYTRSGAQKSTEIKKWLIWILAGLVIIMLAEFVPNLLRTFF